MKKCVVIIFLLLPFAASAQIITTFAGGGTGGLGDGGPATAAVVPDPIGGIFDKYGNYYCAEATAEIIRKVSNTGIITTIAGTFGSSGFSGDSDLATTSMLYSPTSVRLDTSGDFYICDADNNRIRKVDAATGIITTIAGSSTAGFGGDSGLAIAAMLSGPQDIYFDKLGNLYIADGYNERVRKINTFGIITTIAGTGFAGHTGDGGPATAAEIRFPTGLAIDDTGNLYVAGDNVVRKITPAGIITTVAGISGMYMYTGDGVPATSAPISPIKLTIDAMGQLIIADNLNRRVYKVDNAGIIHTIAGNGMAGFTGDGVPATATSLDYPSGVALDSCGNLYITEANNKRVRKVIFDTLGVPSISILPAPNDTVCAGTPITYTTSVSSGLAISYRWYINGIFIGATSSSYTYIPSNGDSIRCVLIAISRCSGSTDTVSSNTIHMVVTTSTTPIITIFSNPSSLVGSIVTINATVTSAGSSYIIHWYNNSILFNTTTTPSVTYTKTIGIDHITATVIPSSVGCYDSTTSSVITITDSSTGLNNIAMPHEAYIYPNPAHSGITVISQNITNVTISNFLGQTFINNECNASQIEINIETLPSGLYVVKLTNNEGQKMVTKIVKE